MILVTGGAGFIGSTLIASLNDRGRSDIIICDDLENGKKLINIAKLQFSEFVNKDRLWDYLVSNPEIETIYHLGACSNTTEWNGKYLFENNFEFSTKLLMFANEVNARFIYASSASVYGLGLNGFTEEPMCERPINAYAASKLLFDNYVRKNTARLSINPVGLRYFNVYGANELHKERMKSTIHIFSDQILNEGHCRLFAGASGYKNGDQKRDFVHVDDCANVNIWFAEKTNIGGIFNVGTGKARSFNDVAKIIMDWFRTEKHMKAERQYIEFPKDLLGRYQNFTEANLTSLRSVECPIKFSEIETSVPGVLNELYKNR